MRTAGGAAKESARCPGAAGAMLHAEIDGESAVEV